MEFDIFQPDPFFCDDRNDVVPADHFLAWSGQIVAAKLHVGHAGEEGQQEDAHSGNLPQDATGAVLFDVELIDSRHLHFIRPVGLDTVPRSRNLEQSFLHSRTELLELFVVLRAQFEQFRYL